MATDNNITTFTAADIEKYHRGQLSNKEMHAMEKAALEDPFLADALEGYAVPGVQMQADMAELTKRLAGKMEGEKGKVIAMHGGRRAGFPWFRAAAAVVIIAGAGLLANQFLFKNKETGIASAETKKAAAADSITPELKPNSAPGTPTSTTGAKDENLTTNIKPEKQTTVSDEEARSTAGATAATGSGDIKDDNIIGENATVKRTEPSVNQPAKTPATETRSKEAAPPGKPDVAIADRNDDLKKKQANPVIAADEKIAERAVAEADYFKDQQNKNVAANRKAEEQGYRNQRNNVFRGRVTDANNVGVPFANVTNVEDKAGTYTDAYGNFILTSPDSALTVQVRSIGFENNQVQLKNNTPTNQVVMQDDRKSLAEVVISNQKPNVAARDRDAGKTLQESEPADGWDNYNTYAANNIEIPEEIKTKPNSSAVVEVSFEVDKNGEPVNIRVEKSLCGQCNKEAIRLIKEGPKWKRNASKKGRTTVTINF